MALDPSSLEPVPSATAEAAVDALQRVLESAAFARAEQCRRFLSYVAHETMAGRGEALNERAIGRLALDRPTDLDTRDDPSVRMLARRVRERLDRYYSGEGRKDPVRIAIPIGQYALSFSTHLPAPEPRAEAASDIPMIVVTRFASEGRASATDRLAAGLCESLVHALTRFPGIRVAGPLAAGAWPAGLDAIDAGNRADASFVMYGSVRASMGVVRVHARLLETQRGEVVWSEQLEVAGAAGEPFGAEDELVARLAAAVADHRGAAHRAALPPARGEQPSGYAALARYYAFVDGLDPGEGAAALDDLTAAVAQDPSSALLTGALASLHSIAVLMRGRDAAGPSYELAEQFARRSLALDPRLPFGHGALATTALARGDESTCLAHVAEMLEAVPHHPTFLYRAGLLTAGCGRWDDGIAIIERATRLNPHHPSHQRTLLVIDRLRRGDVAAALAHAELISFRGYVWGPLCLAMCLKEIGDHDGARRQVDALLAESPDFFDRAFEILSAAPAISLGTAEFLLGHVRELDAIRGA